MRHVALVVLLGLSGPTQAFAQACTSSCSERETTCRAGAMGPAVCADAKAKCMKTGVWVGPNTGRSFPNTCKK